MNTTSKHMKEQMAQPHNIQTLKKRKMIKQLQKNDDNKHTFKIHGIRKSHIYIMETHLRNTHITHIKTFVLNMEKLKTKIKQHIKQETH